MKPISYEEAKSRALADIAVDPAIISWVNDRIVRQFPRPCSISLTELQSTNLCSTSSMILATIGKLYEISGWDVTVFGVTHTARIEISPKDTEK